MTTVTKTLSATQLSILSTAAQRPNRMALPLPADLRARGAARRAPLAALLEAGFVDERPTEDQTLSWRQDGQGGHHALQITATGLAAIGHPIGTAKPDSPEDAPTPGHASTPTAKGATVLAAELTATIDGVNAIRASDAAALAAAIPSVAARPQGKLGRVLDAVAAEDGATLAELAALTGWQPHTTRAALTGLRRRGFTLVLAEGASAGSRKAYRLRQEVMA
jgi:hypothetical protein